MTNKAHKAKHRCDFPGCESREARRIDIQVNWFRGDDVVMLACKEHRAPEHAKALLATEKARRQL